MKIRTMYFLIFTVFFSLIFIFSGFQTNHHFVKQQKTSEQLPQNPLEGRIIFERYGCISCHSINGYGGKTAPDFNSKNFISGDYGLITEMWNHSPEMLKKIDQLNIKQKKITPENFRKLRNFIYFLGYMSSNGSVSKGQELFEKKNCSNCHSIGKTEPGKINLDKTGYYASPIYLAQVMWNHSVQMHKKHKVSNIKKPLFKNNEFADLSAYLRTITTLKERSRNYMFPGNPVKGEKLFKSKNCSYCHLQKSIGPSLNSMNLNKNVNEIAGLMWNHSNVMESAMRKNNISWPTFKKDEMGNLIAYLYFSNNEKVKGSVNAGKQLLESKGCLNCHYDGNSIKAPILADIKPFDNIDEFSSELWNHLPIIEKEYYINGEKLPKLLPEDVKSLYLYFNRTKK